MAAEETDVARSTADLGIIGGVLLILCLFAVAAVGRPKVAEFMAFVFLAGLAPPLASIAFFVCPPALSSRVLLSARLFLAVSAVGLLGLFTLEIISAHQFATSSPFLATIALSAMAAFGLVYFRPAAIGLWSATGEFDTALIALLVVTVVFFSCESGSRMPTVIGYVRDTPHFLWWLLFGTVFVAGVAWLRVMERQRIVGRLAWVEWTSLALLATLVLTLFNDDLFLNLHHYLVHVGPAMHAFHGGIAMVDVYCIYGLMPWLLIKWAFSAIAPTFGTAALVVQASMLAYCLVMGVALYAVARQRISALLLMAPFILVAVTFHPGLYSLYGLPSTTGLRYLVPALMVAVLTAVRSLVWSRWLATALLVLASFWSIETFVYTLAPWGYLLFLETVRTRSIWRPGGVLLLALGSAVTAHIVFIVATYALTGEVVDYRPYLDLVANFRPDQTGFWAQFAEPKFHVWIAVWLGFFLVLAAATLRALRGGSPADAATRLVPVAAFGFAALNYFAGVPRWSSLGLAFLPTAIVIICSMEILADRTRDYGRPAAAAFVALSMVSAALVAFGAERFARPPLLDQGNRTVLRRCFGAEGCRLTDIPAHFSQSLYASPLDPNGPVYRMLHDQNPVAMPPWWQEDSVLGYARAQEVADILRRLDGRDAPVGILVDTQSASFVSVVALMQTGRWYRWPLSSPLNDDISLGITALVLDRIARSPIRDGEVVILTNTPSRREQTEINRSPTAERDRMLGIEEKMLALIKRRCRLALVETREFNSVFKTAECSAPP